MIEHFRLTVHMPGVREEEKAPDYDTWISQLEVHFSRTRPILGRWHNSRQGVTRCTRDFAEGLILGTTQRPVKLPVPGLRLTENRLVSRISTILQALFLRFSFRTFSFRRFSYASVFFTLIRPRTTYGVEYTCRYRYWKPAATYSSSLRCLSSS